MQLTKYEHACFTLEKDGQVLVVDPGEDTHDFVAQENTVGVLITHKHSDHFSERLVTSILDLNPAVKVFGPKDSVEMYDANACIIENQSEVKIGPFTIKMYPGRHDAVHQDFPTVAMLRYLIDDSVYYGGDTIAIPDDIYPSVMMVPISANWFRFGEVVDAVRRLHPHYAIGTHDRLLSEVGRRQASHHMTNLLKPSEITYRQLDASMPLEIPPRDK